MTPQEKANRRLELEQAYWELQRELGNTKNGCDHSLIKKGRLMYSPRQGKVIQTYDDDPRSNKSSQEVINNGRCKDVESVTMYCQICDKDFGWYCPVNIKGYCEYSLDPLDWNGNCIHCGQPSERK